MTTTTRLPFFVSAGLFTGALICAKIGLQTVSGIFAVLSVVALVTSMAHLLTRPA